MWISVHCSGYHDFFLHFCFPRVNNNLAKWSCRAIFSNVRAPQKQSVNTSAYVPQVFKLTAHVIVIAIFFVFRWKMLKNVFFFWFHQIISFVNIWLRSREEEKNIASSMNRITFCVKIKIQREQRTSKPEQRGNAGEWTEPNQTNQRKQKPSNC